MVQVRPRCGRECHGHQKAQEVERFAESHGPRTEAKVPTTTETDQHHLLVAEEGQQLAPHATNGASFNKCMEMPFDILPFRRLNA
ncbi:MAG TPA: hypothetical protein PK760_08385, partial [Flavobacteriales bacterium]|nr:hypothetical protein [Flavobacteriales bacterium]